MRPDSRLECAIFQLDEARTRCELWVTAGNETEKLASGSLKPFLTHLKAAQEQIALGQSSIALEVPSNSQTLWFTKGTVERFVRFVTTPDVLERVNIVETERRQLEEAINILSDQQQQRTGSSGAEAEDLIDESAAGDSSKNQLLVAMDARRIMLEKEQLNAFGRAAAAGFDAAGMPDLIEFSQYFGAFRFRDACSKFATVYKKMLEKGQLSDWNVDLVQDSGDDNRSTKARRTWSGQNISAAEALSDATEHEQLETIDDVLNASTEFKSIPDSSPNPKSPPTDGIAQETPPSRRLPRRASSPRRRSCSPGRIKVGRSGSRRQGMVVIRNINYASPGSGRSSQPAAANDNSSDESDSVVESEEIKQENHRRLSVQDAISLFERKQRDSLESQASKVGRSSTETVSSSGKSVLKRWGSIGDGSTVGEDQRSEDNLGEATFVATTKAPIEDSAAGPFHTGHQEQFVSKADERDLSNIPRIEERRRSWVTAQKDLEWKFQQLKMQEAALPAVRSSKDTAAPLRSSKDESVKARRDPVPSTPPPPPPPPAGANTQFGFQYRGQKPSRGAVSRSWSASSEQDLVAIVNQAEASSAAAPEPSSHSQREHGRLYEQYRERRDAKIRQESDSKKAERESKLKAMQEILDKRKAELVAGGSRSAEKLIQAPKSSNSSRKGMLQSGRTTSTSSSRSSPTVSSSSQTTPRASRHLPPEPRPRAARRLSPGPAKPASGPSSRNSTSSPKLPRNTVLAGQRRPSGMSDNPLSRSMPSLSELRKENTRPSARTPQQSKPVPAKNTKATAGNGGAARHRTVSKVLPLESNGVMPTDFSAVKTDTPPKRNPKTLLTTVNGGGDSQILTPLKLLQVHQQQAVSRIPTPTPKPATAPQETKAFLRKGRGIGPGAGPGVMKLKAASTSDIEEEEKTGDQVDAASELGDSMLSASTTDAVVAPIVNSIPPPAPEKPEVPGSVRESQEMDIDTSSVEGDKDPKPETDLGFAAETVSNKDPDPVRAGVQDSVNFDNSTHMDWSVPVVNAPPATSKLTLIQQIATETFLPFDEQRFTAAAPPPAIGVPVLRHSASPDLDGAKSEKSQRKKWGSSQQKTIPVLPMQQMPQPGISKESPKGFKRLLKFGRKSRGNGSSNAAEWVSASTTSEGDEDSDVSRDTSAGYGSGSSFLRRSIEAYSREPDHTGPRSFFSLSNFRSKGGSESKR